MDGREVTCNVFSRLGAREENKLEAGKEISRKKEINKNYSPKMFLRQWIFPFLAKPMSVRATITRVGFSACNCKTRADTTRLLISKLLQECCPFHTNFMMTLITTYFQLCKRLKCMYSYTLLNLRKSASDGSVVKSTISNSSVSLSP